MNYEVREWLVDNSKHSLKCPYSMQAQFITAHNTANDASAHNEVSYMRNNNNATSFHVAIDDKEAVIGIPFNRNAWHTGDGSGNNSGNRKSVGIEICYSKSGGERYKKAEDNAAHYIAKLLKERGWGVERVKQHWDWPRPKDGYRKNCPHRIRDEGRWNQFLNKIKSYMEDKPKEPIKEGLNLDEAMRIKARNLLKNAVKKGVISKTVHTNAKIDKYTDELLFRYIAAVAERTL